MRIFSIAESESHRIYIRGKDDDKEKRVLIRDRDKEKRISVKI